MGIGREIFFGLAKKVDDASSSWVQSEVIEGEKGKTEIINFKAKKIHSRAARIYETVVRIENDTNIFIKQPKKEFEFPKSDIRNVKLKKSFIFSIGYTLICGSVGVLSILAGLLPLGLLTFAVAFYTALIKVIRIELKDGKKINIYYNTKKDPEILMNKLNADTTESI